MWYLEHHSGEEAARPRLHEHAFLQQVPSPCALQPCRVEKATSTCTEKIERRQQNKAFAPSRCFRCRSKVIHIEGRCMNCCCADNHLLFFARYNFPFFQCSTPITSSLSPTKDTQTKTNSACERFPDRNCFYRHKFCDTD